MSEQLRIQGLTSHGGGPGAPRLPKHGAADCIYGIPRLIAWRTKCTALPAPIRIILCAERRTGELLREAAQNGTRQTRGSAGGRGNRKSPVATIKDLGIRKDQSSDWQQLATLPPKLFEAELRKDGMLSTEQILLSTGKKKINPSPIEGVSYDAIDVCGLLKTFEREKFLERTPKELLETMLPHMIEDIARLGPLVIEWLKLLTEEATKCLTTTVQNS